MAAVDQEGKVDDAQRALMQLKEKGNQAAARRASANQAAEDKIEQLPESARTWNDGINHTTTADERIDKNSETLKRMRE